MEEFQVGGWRVQPGRNRIVRAGQARRLEPRVMDLLVYLAERHGEVLSSNDILRDVWPHQYVTDSALLTAISALRKALGDSARKPTFVQTVPKRGYRLIAPCSARRAAVMVLPIQNRSGKAADDYFADGITELLIAELGTIPALRVISRQTAMRFKSTNRPGAEAMARLGAGIIVTGDVVLDGGRVTLSMGLVDVRQDECLWARSYELPLSDVLSTQRDIAAAIAGEISRRLRPYEADDGDAPSVRAGALIDYMRGRFHWNKLSPQHFDAARRYFESALEKDPDFAPAEAGIADVWGAYGYWGLMKPADVRQHVHDACLRSEAIDGRSAEAQMLLGAYNFYFERDWREAESRFRRAIDLNPNLAHARSLYALFLATLRRSSAHDEVAFAVRLDPLNPAALLVQALCYTAEARWDEAHDVLHDILDLEPTHPPALQLQADIAWLNDPDEAIEEEAGAWAGDPEVRECLADASARTDLRERISTAADRLIARSAHGFVPPLQVARLLVHAGRHEAALEHLEHAVQNELIMQLDLLQLGAAWHPLREKSRFVALKARLGLPP
jgi:TolB-like protein